MTDRSVQVALYCNATGFVAGIKTAQTATAGLASSLEKSAAKGQALRSLGNAAGVMGAVFGAAVVGVVAATAKFEQAMSAVQAATHATAGQMKLLSDAAIQAGQDTQFSATEAAAAEEALAKAGVSVSDILGGALSGSLSLAAAGGQSVADAAESAATAMNQFGLSGADVGHVADLLAAGAGKAMGEVSDLSMALNQAGLIANQTGLSIEETTGALAAFASEGLIGSDAGTSLKTMLQSLTPTSAKAASLMDELGISAYNSQGNFIGLSKYAGVLQQGLAGMSEEQRNATLKTLFGSDAVRAATVLYDQGATGISHWIDKVNDQGYAAETAAIKMDNLSGDLEQLKGSLETAFITTGEGGQAPLRALVQDLTRLVNAYNELPPAVKGAGLELAGFMALLGGGAFVFTRLAAGLVTAKTSMGELGISTGKLNGRMIAARAGALGLGIGLKILSDSISDSHQTMKALTDIAGDAAIGFSVGGPWGAAIGGAAGLLMQFGNGSEAAARQQADLANATNEVAGTLNKETGAITESTRAWADHRAITSGALDDARALGLSLPAVMKAFEGDPAALKLVNAQIAEIGDNMSLIDGGGVSDTAESLIHFQGILGNTTGAVDAASQHIQDMNLIAKGAVPSVHAMGVGLLDGGTAASQAAVESRGLGGAITHTTGSMEKQISTAKGLAAALDGLNSKTLDVRSTERDWQASIDDATASMRTNGKTLNTNTEKGRANAATLDAMASAAIAHAGAMSKDGKSLDQVNGFLVTSHARLVTTAEAFGMSANQAEAYANRVLRIPKSAATKVSTPGLDAANSGVQSLADKAHALNGQVVTVPVHFELSTYGSAPVHIGIPGSARGGLIRGPGTGTSDSILTRLSDGEFVVRAAQAQRHLALLQRINMGGLQGMARGGSAGHGIGTAITQNAGGDEMTAEQLANAIAQAWKHFGFGPKADASKVKSEVHDLISALRDALGKDAPILDHLREVGKRLVDAAKAQDRATAMLDKLREAQAQYAASVAATFRNDIFGNGVSGMLTQLRADRNDAKAMNKALHQAKAKGLDGGLFKALAASGDLHTAQELAHMTPKQIHQYEQLYAQRQKATASLGQFAGHSVYGEQIKRQNVLLHKLDHRLNHLEHTIEHLGHHVKQGAREGSQRGTRDGAAQGMRAQGRVAAYGTR